MAEMPQPPLTEVGRIGLKHFSGTLYEEFHTDLKADKSLKIFREMRENEPIINAMFYAFRSLMGQAAIRVDGDGADDAAVELVSTAWARVSGDWPRILDHAIDPAFTFGYSLLEIVYEQTPNGVVWKKFAPRSPESRDTWEFDENDEWYAWTQRPAPSYKEITIPRDKLLHFVLSSDKNSPEGRSLLRGVYKPYYFLKRIEVIEAIAVERNLNGVPVAYVPPEIANPQNSKDTTSRNAFRDLVRNVRVDEQMGIVFPLAYDADGRELYKLDLLSVSGQNSLDTSGILERYAQRIASIILADFMFLGHTNTGTFSLASDKTHLFAVAIGAALDAVLNVFNEQAIPRLLELNGMDVDPETRPTLVHGDIEDADLEELGNYVANLARSNFPLFPNEPLQAALLQAAHLPVGDMPEQAYAPGLGIGSDANAPRTDVGAVREADQMAKLADEVTRLMDEVRRMKRNGRVRSKPTGD